MIKYLNTTHIEKIDRKLKPGMTYARPPSCWMEELGLESQSADLRVWCTHPHPFLWLPLPTFT